MRANVRKSTPWRWWWPAVVVMAIIFIGSTDLGAASHQSRFLVPFLKWLGCGEEVIGSAILLIRKCAHLTEYAILGVLVWRGWRRQPVFAAGRPWNWGDAARSLGFCLMFAASDEFHQSFVPSRGASVVDVLIDAGGALAGLGLLWLWHRWRGGT